MTKLVLAIQESSYSFVEPESGIETQTKGGFARRSADLEDASLAVTVTWKMTEAQYVAFVTFFKVDAQNGSAPFTLDLLIDNSAFAEYTAYFSSAGPQITNIIGLNYFVTDTLEVAPLPIDENFDSSLVAVYNASNGDVETYLNWFNIIVNINWPTV